MIETNSVNPVEARFESAAEQSGSKASEKASDSLNSQLLSESAARPSQPRIPDFFIVGAPRCGTTWLYENLKDHPRIFMPELKEPHFRGFCGDLGFENCVERIETYLDLFKPAEADAVVGEASVFYLASEQAAARIHEFSSEARIIAILRNPIEMAYSNHRKNISLGVENEFDFQKALDLEPARTKDIEAGALSGGDVHKLRYLHNARFAEQVNRYLEQFTAEKVLVLLFDDIVDAPVDLYARVCRFLGIEGATAQDCRESQPECRGSVSIIDEPLESE